MIYDNDDHRFDITITNYRWSCGDGCCSDSGYQINCFDNETGFTVYEDIDWDSHSRWGTLLDDVLKKIEAIINREPKENDDYWLSFWTEESDGNEWQGQYEDFDYAK